MPGHSSYTPKKKSIKKVGLNSLRRLAIQGHDINFLSNPIRGTEKQNPGVVRRPARIIAERNHFAFDSSEGGDEKQAAAVALGAENNTLSIRRPIRLPIVLWRFCHLNRIAAAHLLHPDVEIAVPIGAIGDRAPIGRPGRLTLQPVAVSKLRKGAEWRLTGLESVADQEKQIDKANYRNQQHRRRRNQSFFA